MVRGLAIHDHVALSSKVQLESMRAGLKRSMRRWCSAFSLQACVYLTTCGQHSLLTVIHSLKDGRQHNSVPSRDKPVVTGAT